MAKKKKTNPRKIPIGKNSFDRTEIIMDASRDNVSHGWILALSAMMEQEGMTVGLVLDTWNTVNAITGSELFDDRHLNETTKKAEQLMGYGLPYPEITFAHVHSQAELDLVKRKIHKNAIFSAFCIICTGMAKLNAFSAEELRRIFFCADLLEAEIENGCTTYEEMIDALAKQHVFLTISEDCAVHLCVEEIV